MNFDKIKASRTIITILGIFFLLYGTFEIFKLFSKTLVNTFSLPLTIYENANLLLAIIFIIQGYILTYIGVYYTNFFKQITKTIVSFSIFFISISLMLFAVNNNSEELTNSIQPSIDILLASSVDSVVKDNIQIIPGNSIDITISESSTINKFYTSNLTINQANLFLSYFELNNINQDKSIFFAKLFISLIYSELDKTDGLSADVAIPVSEIQSQISNLEIDLKSLELIDTSLIKQFFDIDENSYITILVSQNSEIKTITVGQIPKNDINLIWEKLYLNPKISLNTKSQILDIFFSTLILELEKSNQKELVGALPIETFGSLIPKEYSNVFDYDILHSNLTIRANQIKKIRDDCSLNVLKINEVCDIIKLTHYNYFLTDIENLSKISNIEIPQTYLNQIEKVNTLEKLNNQIETFSKQNMTFLIIGIIILFLSGLSYFTHQKINNLNINYFDISKEIFKINVYSFLISFIFLIIGYIIITSQKTFDYIKLQVPETIKSIIEIFPSLPMILIFNNILLEAIIYYLIYLIIILIIYLSLHFYIKFNTKNQLN